ncbi:MAG: SDR family oxidoreductase [Acidimicrobiales bacterium]
MAASVRSGTVVVITGANSGIGKEAAVVLARRGATVLLTSRDRANGETALDDVRRRSGAGERVQLGNLDLASFRSIRRFAAEVLDRHERLDVLVNNAGLILEHRLFTDEGFEMMMGVNHIGHFLLTNLLLDRLRASAPARIVNVSSIAHRTASVDSLRDDLMSELTFEGTRVYGESKLANVLHANELARRLAGSGVTANSLHPGIIRSGFARDGDTTGMNVVFGVLRPFLMSPGRGARTTVHVASSPKVEGITGRYFVRRRLRRPSAAARDADAARWLWDESARLVAAAGA